MEKRHYSWLLMDERSTKETILSSHHMAIYTCLRETMKFSFLIEPLDKPDSVPRPTVSSST